MADTFLPCTEKYALNSLIGYDEQAYNAIGTQEKQWEFSYILCFGGC